MAKRGAKDYKFRGRAVEGRGRTLDAALSDLDGYWNSRPSLVMHDYGVLQLQIVLGTTTTIVEIADKQVIDQVEAGNTDVLVAFLASKANLTTDEMQALLTRADEVIATVDRIRPPSDPNFWTPTPGTEPEVVLPTVISSWAVEAVAKPTSPTEKRKAVGLVAIFGTAEGKGLTQISRETGIPRSTLRDALEREKKAQARTQAQAQAQAQKEAQEQARALARAQLPRGHRTSEEDKKQIADLYAEVGNATEVARQLGLPDRTVRGIVERQKKAAAESPTGRRTRTPKTTTETTTRKSELKEELQRLVEEGLSASAAGRQLNVPERTARSWIEKIKK